MDNPYCSCKLTRGLEATGNRLGVVTGAPCVLRQLLPRPCPRPPRPLRPIRSCSDAAVSDGFQRAVSVGCPAIVGLKAFTLKLTGQQNHAGPARQRRGCYSADAHPMFLLNRLLKVEGGAAE